ncbi:MAG: NAD(P)H-binding protein [Siphonobacter sp.]
MKLLLLGCTGRTGKILLQEALKAGHTITVLVRDKSKIPASLQDRLTIFESPDLDESSLENAVMGCEVVVSTLNISRKSDFPWATLRTPSKFLSGVMEQLIDISVRHGVKRVLVLTAWGVHETKSDIPGWFRWLIDHSNIGVAYRDHERQEDLLQASTLNWTIVRPVGLTNGTKAKTIIITFHNTPKPNLTISRYNVARFMLDAMQLPEYYQKTVTIST